MKTFSEQYLKLYIWLNLILHIILMIVFCTFLSTGRYTYQLLLTVSSSKYIINGLICQPVWLFGVWPSSHQKMKIGESFLSASSCFYCLLRFPANRSPTTPTIQLLYVKTSVSSVTIILCRNVYISYFIG